MRIGIDATPLLGNGGISRYIVPLMRSLLESDQENTYHPLFHGWRKKVGANDALQTGFPMMRPASHISLPDRFLDFWWSCLGLKLPFTSHLWREWDLFLVTCYVAPVLKRGHLISIIYDLIPLRYPEFFKRHHEFRRRITRLLTVSEHLIAISECTKWDLVEAFDIDPLRIRVISPGVDESFRPLGSGQINLVLERYRIKRPYILYVGSLSQHKNVITLMKAYEKVRMTGQFSGALVLIGRREWGQETLGFLKNMKVRSNIVVTDFVPHEDLVALYGGAEVFVFPSLYEGFGLPPLEAMACGVPVITSKTSSLPEVVGDAGILVDPTSVHEISDAIVMVLENESLQHRMVKAGLERARLFSWEGSAQKMLDVFEEVKNGDSFS